MATFYKMTELAAQETLGDSRERILKQLADAGFSGNLKVFHLGFDTEDSFSLIVEGTYDGEECCVALGYGMNRHSVAIRKKWYRHAPPEQPKLA